MDVRPLARAEWNAALLDYPTRSVFHRLEWLELVEEAMGTSLALIEVVDRGRRVGIMPQLGLRKGPLLAVGSPLPGWSTAYMGPLASSATDAVAVVEAARSAKPLSSASYAELRVLDIDGQAPALKTAGFEELLRFETYLLALGRDEEALFAALTSKCRNIVRKGQKNGFVVRDDLEHFIHDFWQMSQEVFGRWGINPGFDERFLHLMVKHLGPSGLIDVKSAFLDDDRAATIVILRDDQTAYYWAGGTFEAHRRSAPNNLLLWECINAANEAGLTMFDFVSSSGSAGKFKKSFGPDAVEIATHWGRSRTRFEAWLKTRYESFVRSRRGQTSTDEESDV